MADLNKKNKLMPKTPKKPNMQMWVILLLLGVILAITYFTKSTSVQEITPRAFWNMVEDGEIKSVLIYKNAQTVEVTLEQEALGKPKYQDLRDNPWLAENGPHFELTVIDPKDFEEKLTDRNEALAADGQQIEYKIGTKSDVGQWFQVWGFIL